jgi:hypothetical protein
LDKVTTSQADTDLVYVTDVIATGQGSQDFDPERR